jgi:hypothetical protein
MMLIKRFILLAVLAAAFSSPSALAWGNHHDDSNCEKSAGSMFKACYFDVRDDLNETIASCQHIADRGDRWACYSSAYIAKGEDSEECGAVHEARVEACEVLDEDRYDPDPLLDPANMFVDPGTPVLTNPYVSVEEGHTYVLRVGEIGEDPEELVVVHVTGETQDVLDVPCRIVVDIAFEVSEEDGEVEYELVEATDDLFALTTAGDVVYCGEVSRNYEDGILRDLDGSFEAGIEWAKAGTLILREAIPGLAHRTEFAPGEAEDIIQYVTLAGGPTEDQGDEVDGFECDGGCLQTFDFAPLDPESTEFKFYLPGIGFVLAVGMEDGEVVEREEIACVGESLDTLYDAECGIGDADQVDALLEELCKVSPEAFCADD